MNWAWLKVEAPSSKTVVKCMVTFNHVPPINLIHYQTEPEGLRALTSVGIVPSGSSITLISIAGPTSTGYTSRVLTSFFY